MSGLWYLSVQISSVTSQSLGYSLNDTVKITSPPNTYITSTWGSMKCNYCSTTYLADKSETECRLTGNDNTFSYIAFGLDAYNQSGARSNGTLTVHAYTPPAHGDIAISASFSETPPYVAPNYSLTGPNDYSQTGSLSWSSKTTIEAIPTSAVGVEYALSTPSFTLDEYLYYEQSGTSRNISVQKDTTSQVSLQYERKPVPTEELMFRISGLPSGYSAEITATDGTNTKTIDINGNMEARLSIPQNHRKWTLTTKKSNEYVSTISPNSFMAGQDEMTVDIEFHEYNSDVQLAAYWGCWTGYKHDLTTYKDVGLTTLYLAFATYSHGTIDTSDCGYMAQVPVEGTQLWPAYQNWTKFAAQNPQTKIVLSLGGESGSSVWKDMTSAKIAAMVVAIKQVLTTKFPIYSGSYAISSEITGYTEIAGIDLDVELGGARMSSDITAQVGSLIKQLKVALPAEKLVTMASFSVGADPQNNCTAPGSVHCGEAIDLLNMVADSIDYVNVMAYDAGNDFATGLYKQAMANYQVYVGKKAVLGLDNQSQWPGFIESEKNLVAKALWAYSQTNVGGTFLWEIGGTGESLSLLTAIRGVCPSN